MLKHISIALAVAQLYLVHTLPYDPKLLQNNDRQTLSRNAVETTLKIQHEKPRTAKSYSFNQFGHSLPITHLFLSNLHVIPIQNVHQQNRTLNLVPVYSYVPIQHNYLVPVQDLSVIPLNRNVQQQQVTHSHYRAMEKRHDDHEEVNRYRTFYGGYGTGLYFGGQGAGHGFYVYG